MADTGSSPLTRGKHPRCARCRPSRGLIPAHAGKTDIESLEGFTNGAHPRSRGENQLAKVHASRQSGSSPLTRGKRVPFGVVVVVVGLIPAHAGKTAASAAATLLWRAHPRSRGENGGWDTPIADWRAHPRSRGENSHPPRGRLKMPGSSPLTRGKHDDGVAPSAGVGLIPAHAGKTCPPPRCPARRRAHPRSRGENKPTRRPPGTSTGSSPLTRGKPQTGDQDSDQAGLIPAHAGKTGSAARSSGARRAHPRSRGENDELASCFDDVTGSSPLTRGKRWPGW